MSKKVKFLSMLVTAVLLLWVGYDMQQLTDSSGFWAYRPLLLLALLTFFITLVRSNFFYSSPWRIRWTSLTTLSGILLYLGFPTMPLTPLIFVAFVPLLLVEHEISRIEEKPFWKIALFSYHTFLVWNITSTFWVSNSSLGGGIFANFVNAALMTIPFMLYSFTKRYLKPNLHAWAFISFWIAYEKLDQYWELTWTWLTLGNTFAQYPSWAQWYEYTGVFGGSLWILLLNVIIFGLVRDHKLWNLSWQTLRLPILLFLIPLILSLGMYASHTDKGVDQNVLVIQPNFEPHYQKFTIPASTQFRKMVDQIKSKLDDDTDYVIMPETVLRNVEISTKANTGYVKELSRQFSKYPDLKIVSGASAYFKSIDSLAIPRRTRRTSFSRDAPIYYESFNAALQLSNNIDTLQFYKKSLLVPGTEIFPYSSLFFFMEGFINSMGGTVAGNGIQAERSVFWNEDSTLAVAPVICYESIYGEYCTEYIRNGANAIFIVTNDGWWDDTPGYKQHLKFASLRAIETRRSIARSANTGSSAYINQRGDILEATNYEEDAVLDSSIKFNNEITFYAVWGDMIARIAILISALLFFNALVHKLTGKKNRVHHNIE